MKKKTIENIIIDFKNIHGDKYVYDKFKYYGSKCKSTILCKIHGEFNQCASKHLSGQGCKLCNTRYSLEEIKEKLHKIHGDSYEFIFNEYLDSRSYATVICRHGERKMKVSQLLDGQGCIHCKGKKWDENDLREKLISIHNNKFLYKEGFIINKDIISIYCKIHGDTIIRKDRHLLGQTCRKCSKRKKYDTSLFVEELKNKIKNCTYEKCKYVSHSDKVVVSCITHGDFESYPEYLLTGHGCKLCSSIKYTQDEYLKMCEKRHPNLDNSKILYIGSQFPIKSSCKIHGDFEQKACYYINRSNGCPMCRETKGERIIRLFLEENKIKFIQEHKEFGFYFDFYLPNNNYYIEFNGKQHYHPIEFFGGEKSFNKQKEKDKTKNEIFLDDKDRKLIIIPYWKMDEIYDILKENILDEN